MAWESGLRLHFGSVPGLIERFEAHSVDIGDLAGNKGHIGVSRVAVPVFHRGGEGTARCIIIVEVVDVLAVGFAVQHDVVHEEGIALFLSLLPGHVVRGDRVPAAVRDLAGNERHIGIGRIIEAQLHPSPKRTNRAVHGVVDFDTFRERIVLLLDTMKKEFFDHRALHPPF